MGLDPDPVTLEALARALDTYSDYREQVWEAWEDELILAACTMQRRGATRYWLDAVVIGGITIS